MYLKFPSNSMHASHFDNWASLDTFPWYAGRHYPFSLRDLLNGQAKRLFRSVVSFALSLGNWKLLIALWVYDIYNTTTTTEPLNFS